MLKQFLLKKKKFKFRIRKYIRNIFKQRDK